MKKSHRTRKAVEVMLASKQTAVSARRGWFCCSNKTLADLTQSKFIILLTHQVLWGCRSAPLQGTTWGSRWIVSECSVTQLCGLFVTPMGCSSWGSSVQEEPGFPRQEYYKWAAISSSRESPQPRDRTHVSCVTGRFFTTESPEKPSRRIDSPPFCSCIVWNVRPPHSLQ